jgi:single-stranded-DNA-specific exonuclease
VTKRCPQTITRFGGHAYAAGLTLPEAALPRFVEAFERVAREWLSLGDLRRTVETDGELAREELTLDVARELAAGIWGQGFPAPVFEGTFTVTGQRIVGAKHTRLALTHDGARMDGIVFNEPGPLPSQVRAIYRPEINHFQGQETLQVVVESWQAA